MKKVLFLFLILLQGAIWAQKKEVVISIGYRPEMTYANTTKMILHTEVAYAGAETLLQQLKDSGLRNPTVTDTQSAFESVMETGRQSGDMFPLTITFANVSGSDGKKIIPDGTIIYGHTSVTSLPALDSIVSPGMEDTFKQAMLATMKTTFSQISFPEKRVSVGESFTVVSPLSIPAAGITTDMGITTTYTLVGVSKGIASFDISQLTEMKSGDTSQIIRASGTGTGKLEYDITGHFYRSYQIDTDMEMTMRADKLDMTIKSRSSTLQTTVMSKSKL